MLNGKKQNRRECILWQPHLTCKCATLWLGGLTVTDQTLLFEAGTPLWSDGYTARALDSRLQIQTQRAHQQPAMNHLRDLPLVHADKMPSKPEYKVTRN